MYYIYKIENLINGKKYIGLTNNIVRRKSRHFTDLKYNHHDNNFLQKEYNIYGKNNFSFEIIFSGEVDYEIISDLEPISKLKDGDIVYIKRQWIKKGKWLQWKK